MGSRAVARWRLWAFDVQERMLEVLKVPEDANTTDLMEFLFTQEEVEILLAELAEGELRIYQKEMISHDDLNVGRVILYGSSVEGEADYYVRCAGFIAMLVDRSRWNRWKSL